MFHDECRLALRKAWDACQAGVAKLPLKDFVNDKDTQLVADFIAGCKASYSKLITDFGLKAFAGPATLKKYDPATRDAKSMQRAQQARDDSGCPMASITPTPGQPLDFDVFHLKCTDAASYKLCVHSLGGDVRPSAATCGPAGGLRAHAFRRLALLWSAARGACFDRTAGPAGGAGAGSDRAGAGGQEAGLSALARLRFGLGRITGKYSAQLRRHATQVQVGLREWNFDSRFDQRLVDAYRQVATRLHPLAVLVGPGAHAEIEQTFPIR